MHPRSDFLSRFFAWPGRIERRLNNINDVLKEIRMKVDELLQEFDAATTQAAVNVENIIATLKAQNGTLTAEQETKATAVIANLKALGTDADEPVPPAPEEFPAPTE